MPTPGAESPIQRVPSGFPGPGGIGTAPCAHGASGGGTQVGFSTLLMMVKWPSGVGYAGCPTATGKETVGCPNRSSVSRWADWSIVIRPERAPSV